MLTELINFTKSLSEDFKSIGLTPKEGLHILMKVDDTGNLVTEANTVQYDFYSKKMNEISPFLRKCIQLQENAWCVNTNKCFDLPLKAIHTCSPICVAFKNEHLVGGKKFISNYEKGKPQINERFDTYFSKAMELNRTDDPFVENIINSFVEFLKKGSWEIVFNYIVNVRSAEYQLLLKKEEQIKEEQKNTSDKSEKALVKEKLDRLQQVKLNFQPLSESDYLLLYLDLPLSIYKATHSKYLEDNLFNTVAYNMEADENGLVFGTNDFQNGYNAKMPFLLHQTATFDITGRISNIDAKMLYEFSKVLPRKSLPNPLPIFIYNDEFKKQVIAMYKEGRKGFRDIVETLYQSHKEDFQNYYLLNWSNTQKGIVFNDFDFVAKFEYEINGAEGWKIDNFFELYSKDGKKKVLKFYYEIKNIFELEDRVLKYLIQNKYYRVDYFSDFKKEDYDNRDMTFLSFCKYRKGIYDYIYKSNRNTIGGKEFDELVFNAIKDDFKNANEYGIKEKLNYWYSLYNYFHNTKNQVNMASKLKDYQQFVSALLSGEADIENATDEHFAFAAGQVIYYLLSKSKSADTSFRLMEPYLQKTNCKSLKENIAEDFTRYKHENFSNNFGKVASFVLSYDTKENIKKLQPQLLSGLFANNQLFSNKNNNE